MNTETIILRLTKELKEKLESKAKELELSLSSYVRMILKKNV